MSDDKKYNGYTNYETWCCALWLDNEQWSNEQIAEKAQELADALEDPANEDQVWGATVEMADYIENLVTEMEELSEMRVTGMFSDLLHAALDVIDYRDIARSRLNDAVYEAVKNKAAVSA